MSSRLAVVGGAAGRGPDRAEIGELAFEALDLEPQRGVAGEGQRHDTARAIGLVIGHRQQS